MGSSQSQVKIGRGHESLRILALLTSRNNKILSPKSRVCFGQSKNLGNLNSNCGFGFALKASQAADVAPVEKFTADISSSAATSKSIDGIRLFVGLPLDAVSECNRVSHEKAIAAGLKALKLMGVDGVELPIWWGRVEKDAKGKYDWSGYLAIAELVQEMDLKLHISLCFHASQQPKIPLPDWVSRVGEADPSIYFTDRSGRLYKDYLSLASDELPVLEGKSPIQVYQEFCDNFKSSFARFMESTITGITIGLGPDGELRYPSYCHAAKANNHPGVGEFQCYDKYMLSHLKQHAEARGNPLWGLGGPHDVPTYDQPPSSNTFFKDEGGSWETPYGDFFLSWYSSQLISHGDRILSVASSVFSDILVSISGKLPLVHSWYRTRSHPSEMTAGFYNTANRNGYESVAEMFAKNSCNVVLPGMDLLDENEPNWSSPQSLLAQIKGTCRKHGLWVSGQNMSVSETTGGFEEIKRNLVEDNVVVDLFTYQRMGADFFSPKHFPLFTTFVRGLTQLDLDVDDMPEDKETVESVLVSSEADMNLHLQAA